LSKRAEDGPPEAEPPAMGNLHLQPTSSEAQSPSRLREVQETPPFRSKLDAPQMNRSTCPQTVPRASSCCMPLPVSLKPGQNARDEKPGGFAGGCYRWTAERSLVPNVDQGNEETMRKFLFIFAFFFVVLPIRATDLYIAQAATGGSTGADCGDALPYTFFNNSSNWPSPIGPGTTVHLCGTITAPAGASSFLSFQGGGANGNPITLKFEMGPFLERLTGALRERSQLAV